MVIFNALQKSISAGIGRYSFELSKELYYLLKDDLKIIIREEDLDDYDFVTSKNLLIFKNIKNSKDRNLFEQIYLPKFIRENYASYVVHYPDSMAPVFLKNNVVITVHDLAFKSLSNAFTKKSIIWKSFMTNLSVKKARKIIAITNFSKSEILKYYNSVEDKVEVVYNGFNNLSLTEINNKNISDKVKDISRKEYILTVSTISPRKNIDTLIKAFKEIKDNYNFNLLVCGANGWLYEDIHKLVDEFNINDRVFFTGKVNDDELKYLYKNSKLFVYPSFYEGFGLPPLEAMSYGVKTILSDVECLREVSGKGCTYFNPNSVDDLVRVLSESIGDGSFKTCDYKSVLSKYSWKTCAERTVDVYNKILKGE